MLAPRTVKYLVQCPTRIHEFIVVGGHDTLIIVRPA